MSRFVLSLLLLAASLAVALTGCMLGPVDGAVVTSTSSVQRFGGYTLNPNEPVQVEVFNGSRWIAIANATSGAAPERRYDGTDLYRWSADAVVPSTGWRRGTTGSAAQVHVLVGSKPDLAFTFTSDWWTCLTSNPGLTDFVSSCKSPRSPNAFLYTSDFMTGVDLTISSITSALGGIDVSVRNGGRPGRIQHIECSREDWTSHRFQINKPINPVERQVYHLDFLPVPGLTRCFVWGLNEDGTYELARSNNSLEVEFY